MYLLIFLFLEKCLCQVSIPFSISQRSLKNLNHSSIMESLYKTNLIINVSLGSPEQNLQLILKHSIFQITIPSSQLKTINPINKFNENESLTFNKTQRRLHPMQEINECYESSDIFNFKTKNLSKVEKLNFLLVTDQEENFKDSGTLGLKPSATQGALTNMNFIKQLKERNITLNYDYYIQFLSENKGEIFFGILPHENSNFDYDVNINDYIVVSGIQHNFNAYKFNQDGTFYGNIEVKDKYNAKLPNELEIGLGLIKGSNPYKDIIEEKFFNISNKCYTGRFLDNYEYIFYYCDKSEDIKKFEDLTFVIKEIKYNFTLTYKDLFFEYGNYYYFLVYFHQKYNSGFTLGIPFFKKYIMTFNQDKKIVGFYKNLKKKSFFNISWPLVFCIIIILFMAGYIIVYRPKNIKKKRANELDDDFEYLPNSYDKLNTIGESKLGI